MESGYNRHISLVFKQVYLVYCALSHDFCCDVHEQKKIALDKRDIVRLKSAT